MILLHLDRGEVKKWRVNRRQIYSLLRVLPIKHNMILLRSPEASVYSAITFKCKAVQSSGANCAHNSSKNISLCLTCANKYDAKLFPTC